VEIISSPWEPWLGEAECWSLAAEERENQNQNPFIARNVYTNEDFFWAKGATFDMTNNQRDSNSAKCVLT